MNPYIEEWIWRFARVSGLPKYVFLAVGRRMKRTRTGEFQVDVAMKTLVADTGLAYSTVDRGSKEVERSGDLEIVRPKRRGEKLRYRIRRQLHLPLDVDAAIRQSSERVLSLFRETNDIRQRADRTEMNVDRQRDDRTSISARARGTTTTTIQDPVTHTPEFDSDGGGGTAPAPVAALEARQRYVAWWGNAYPTYHNQARNRIDDRPRGKLQRTGYQVVLNLLGDYEEDQLREMAITMWTTTTDGVRNSNAEFLTRPDNDHSIFVLDGMAAWLHVEAKRRAAEAAGAAEEQRRQRRGQDLASHVERVIERLRQAIADTASTTFGELLAGIAEELSTLDVDDRLGAATRLEDLDVAMLQAARAAAGDDRQLQAEADAELTAYRGHERYQHMLNAVIDRLVRERFQLPVLVWSGAGAGRSVDVDDVGTKRTA